MTRPWASSSGPPEFPGLIGASVCTALRIFARLGASMLRPVADTTPTVRDRSSPNGLPIAIAPSPTRTARELPSGSTVSRPATAGSTFTSARSVDASRPMTVAGTGSSSTSNCTVVRPRPATMCWLVTRWPRRSMTNAAPVATPSPRVGGPVRAFTPGGR